MNDSLAHIPFHRPSIGQEEISAVEAVLRSGWLTTGGVTLQFEKEFADYVGAKHAISVNSCTAALQLALDAIGLKPGDEVLIPTYTFTATGEVVTYFGAVPVLCDSQAGGFNVDPADVKRRITRKTKAIMPVHIAGEPCDLDEIHAIADRAGLKVIEDAAHTLPASYQGRNVGTLSDLTAFSFYATKTITTGEGGMLTTDNDDYATRARTMRLHGIARDAWNRYSKDGSWYYEVVAPGYKFNLTDIASALGRAQLAKANRFWNERSLIAASYREALKDVPEIVLPECGRDRQHSYHLFIIRIKSDALTIGRDEFILRLKDAGIGTSVHFIPLHMHPYYRSELGYRNGDFPNAEQSYAGAISLPIYPGLSEREQERVISAVRNIVERHRKVLVHGFSG